MKQFKWNFLEVNADEAAALSQAMPDTRDVLRRILLLRGLKTFDLAKDFFNPQLNSNPDPFLMKDMAAAVDRILKAIKNGEKILLFGDYDVDGTTSVALMLRYLKKKYNVNNVEYYIPDRNLEGYGLSLSGMEYALEKRINLIITLDCGISSADLIGRYAPHFDFIICDHHIPGPVIPNAVGVLNPKQELCQYPFKELCGCGIAFKFVTAINRKLGYRDDQLSEYLDLVAVAIGADIVTLTGENRVLCYHGLAKLNKNPVIGLKALMQVSGGGVFDNHKSVFQIAPRINAAGRMAHGRLAVELLIEDDFENALEKAKALNQLNEDRKSEHLKTADEAAALISQNVNNRFSTVVHKPEWHKGILGIVASKLQETHLRPTIVLTTQNDVLTGSARSVKGFNIYDALFKCKDYLVEFGGHAAAAGLSLHVEKLDEFSEKFEEVAAQQLTDEYLCPEVHIDTSLQFGDLDYRIYNSIKRMEPFGPDNPRPVFYTATVIPTEYTSLIKDKHIRFVFRWKENFIRGIGFNIGYKFCEIVPGDPIDIVYSIKENIWKNQSSLQLEVIDFRKSSARNNN